MRSFFMRPPEVYNLEPFQTWRMDPVCIFLVTRLARFTLRVVLRRAFLGLDALRTALGAFGFMALRAFRRVVRRVVRRVALAFLGLEALRAVLRAALTAMLVFLGLLKEV